MIILPAESVYGSVLAEVTELNHNNNGNIPQCPTLSEKKAKTMPSDSAGKMIVLVFWLSVPV